MANHEAKPEVTHADALEPSFCIVKRNFALELVESQIRATTNLHLKEKSLLLQRIHLLKRLGQKDY